MKIFIFLVFCDYVKKLTFAFLFFMHLWSYLFVPIKIYICQAPQNDHLNLSFVKDEHIVGKNIARNGHKMAIYQLLFFRE